MKPFIWQYRTNSIKILSTDWSFQVVSVHHQQKKDGGIFRSRILLTCSWGYAASMIEAISHTGAEFGLRPAGEERFNQWLKGLEQ